MTRAIRQRVSGQPPMWPTAYHDYVFREGKLIGEFDNMYRHAKGIPWHQHERCHHWSSEAGLLMMKAQAPYETILEVGCGLGYIAAKLKPFVAAGGTLEAFDISPTAIQRARRLHPGVRFYVNDITRASFRPRKAYDLVVVKDLLWYVLDHLETVLRNLQACVRPQGWLYVGQSFPALNRPFIGSKVLPMPETLLARLGAFQPRYTAQLRNHDAVQDGPVFHFLGNRR